MFLGANLMADFLTAVLTGGFAGAAVAAALAKFLIQNQLSKSLKSYQHELDLKKEALQVDLSIYAAGERQKLTDYEQKRVTAIESIYAAFAGTSLPRHKFQKKVRLPRVNSGPNELASAYFKTISANFNAFQRAFDSISAAYSVLELHAIYVEQDLERDTALSLSQINSYFMEQHERLNEAHDQAQELFRDGSLGTPETWFDFEAFHSELNLNWNRITGPIRSMLRNKVRQLLKPQHQTVSKDGGE